MAESESKKKIILVVCSLGVAGVIMGYQFFGGSSRGQVPSTVWMKCTNSQCKAEFQMPTKDWTEFLLQNLTSNGGIKPVRQINPEKGCECPQCNKTTALKAIKCEKCEFVFFEGAAKGKPSNVCPKCGYDPLAKQ